MGTANSVRSVRWKGNLLPGLAAIITLVVIACGSSATSTTAPMVTPQPTQETSSDASSPTSPASDSTPAPDFANTPVPTTEPTAAPDSSDSARDNAVLVTNLEPVQLDSWSTACSNLYEFICGEVANEPLVWMDASTYEVVPLSTVESWEQIDDSRWRFVLREGITFHNGEPWNATTAKAGIDANGDVNIGRASFRYHGVIHGEVVDDYVLDVVCDEPCPIFPNSALFTTFQAPEWYASANEEQRSRNTVGTGPYKLVEWVPGVEVSLEAFEDYQPGEHSDARAPAIKNATQVWRGEALVRSSMIQTGEADWAMDIGFEYQDQVPAYKLSGTTEVFALVPDTLWHPELQKTDVRRALAHGMDCASIVDALYGGMMDCIGNISVMGTIGITEENYAPYEYDPELAMQLLNEAGYDPANKITIFALEDRVYRDVEVMEAVVSNWTEIGVNAELQVMEASSHREITNSGCGQYGEEALDCATLGPPQPYGGSSHLFTTATSNEMLDMQVQAFRRMGCFSILSRVCDPELQEKIETAMATPLGDMRQQRMEEIADIAHDEVYFMPFVHVQMVYGVSPDLVWEPYYAPRLRVNTMSFGN